MSDPTQTPPEDTGEQTEPAAADVGQAQVQEHVDADIAEGVHGTKVDPEPDSTYTAPGAETPGSTSTEGGA